MSSNAPIEYEYDDDSEDAEDDVDTEDDEDSSFSDDESNNVVMPLRAKPAAPQRRARFQRPYRTILYISMEYCEKRVSDVFCLQSYVRILLIDGPRRSAI